MAAEVHYTVRKKCSHDIAELCALIDNEEWNVTLLDHESYHAMNPDHAYVAVLSSGKIISKYLYYINTHSDSCMTCSILYAYLVCSDLPITL